MSSSLFRVILACAAASQVTPVFAQDASPSALVDRCGGVRMTVALSAEQPLTAGHAHDAAAVLTERLPGSRLFGRNLVAEVEVLSDSQLRLHRAGSETFGISDEDLFEQGDAMSVFRVLRFDDEPETGEGEIAFDDPDGNGFFIVEAEPAIAVFGTSEAEMIFDQNNQPAVSVDLDNDASEAFCALTAESLGEPIGVVMDGVMLTAPTVQSAICGGSVMFSGSFMMQEAEDLAARLRAGQFQYDFEILEQTIVAPLDADAAGCAVTAAVGD